MNEQITKTTPTRDNVTPSLAALIVVGATVTAATPFWPQALARRPRWASSCWAPGSFWPSSGIQPSGGAT